MRTAIILLALLAAACAETAPAAAPDTRAAKDAGGTAHADPELSWDQLALGCAIMGAGEKAHVMCNHGHSLSLHNENLYERWLFLKDHGVPNPTDAQLMAIGKVPGSNAMLPEPLSPLLRARLGERVRLRVVSYGPLFHTFHVHGHLWLDGDVPTDTHTMGPAEVYDAAEFYAGGGATSAESRAGTGDWMYHCHVETHMATGMWGIFRVLPKESSESLGKDGKFPFELPPLLGGAGQTVDVYVVAVEAPLVVARAYSLVDKSLVPIERMARLYVPLPDEAAWKAAKAQDAAMYVDAKPESWTPWVLALRQGTTVRVHLRNLMTDVPASLHPHGVAYDNMNDGTMTDNVALPGGPAVLYTWKADTPGTWPLHDHSKTLENISRGLFAAIVVKTPEEEQKIARDYVVFMHDFDMDWFMGSDVPSGSGH